MKTFLEILLAFFFAAQALAQSSPPTSSVDEELLEDLENDLFDGLELPPAGERSEPDPQDSGPKSEPDDHEPKTEPQPVDGEDLGQPAARANPLREITDSMQQVESRLRKNDSADQTQQLQADILQKMDDVLAELEKQQQDGQRQSNPQQNQSSQDQNQDQPKDGNQPENSQPNNSDSGSGTSRESSDNRPAVNYQEVVQNGQVLLIKRVWGQLPDRVREEILSQSGDEFLPEYRNLIEDYYKRLAEEGSASP